MAERYEKFIPGIGEEKVVTPREYLLHAGHLIQVAVTIDSSARDAENTPTTTLRKGLCLGKITESGKYKEYDAGASDGSQTGKCILDESVKVIDADGNAVDAIAAVVFHAFVDDEQLIGSDEGFKADVAGQIIFP